MRASRRQSLSCPLADLAWNWMVIGPIGDEPSTPARFPDTAALLRDEEYKRSRSCFAPDASLSDSVYTGLMSGVKCVGIERRAPD